jgi:G3E family GTPase
VGCTAAGSLTLAIKKLKNELDPDFLFVEPFELVTTNEIRGATTMGFIYITYEIGPYIALIDAATFELLWEERRPTLLNHARGADMVAITRIDLVGEREVDSISSRLGNHINGVPVIKLGSERNDGLNEALALIQS